MLCFFRLESQKVRRYSSNLTFFNNPQHFLSFRQVRLNFAIQEYTNPLKLEKSPVRITRNQEETQSSSFNSIQGESNRRQKVRKVHILVSK